MYQILELIGLLTYAAVSIIVLITIFLYSDKERRQITASISFIFLLIFTMIFIPNIIIQFFLFIIVLITTIHLIYVYIIPEFYSRSEPILFIEVPKEIWEQVKVQDTIIKTKPKKKNREVN